MTNLKVTEKMKVFENCVYTVEEGQTVYKFYDVLFKLQELHKVDFWDFKGSDGDFDRWRESKGYGDTDPTGVRSGASNVWYKEQKADIASGAWVTPEYCSFIGFLADLEPELFDFRHDNVTLINMSHLLERSKEADYEQYGKEDYRTQLATVLLENLDEDVAFTGIEE